VSDTTTEAHRGSRWASSFLCLSWGRPHRAASLRRSADHLCATQVFSRIVRFESESELDTVVRGRTGYRAGTAALPRRAQGSRRSTRARETTGRLVGGSAWPERGPGHQPHREVTTCAISRLRWSGSRQDLAGLRDRFGELVPREVTSIKTARIQVQRSPIVSIAVQRNFVESNIAHSDARLFEWGGVS